MMRRLYPILCGVFFLSALHCSKDPVNSGNGTPLGPSSISETITLTYEISGNLLITWNQDSISLYTYCNGNQLITSADTSSGEEIIAFELSGQSALKLYIEEGQGPGGQTIRVYYEFKRSGAGNGITGQWTLQAAGYDVTGGTLTPAEKAELDSEVSEMNMEIVNGEFGMTFAITATTITGTLTAKNYFADYFIETWNNSGNAGYAITVSQINAGTVQLTGQKSGEVVTIFMDADGNTHFISSDSTRAHYIYYENPVSCPNEEEPEWYRTFLEANSNNTTAKTAAPSVPALSAATQSFHRGRITGLWKAPAAR